MEKLETAEPVTFKCDTCGWEFAVVGEFDGRHGDARTHEYDSTKCDDVAKEVTNG